MYGVDKHRLTKKEKLLNSALSVFLLWWIVHGCWTNLTCDCYTRMSASFIVEKVDMWLLVIQSQAGIHLPFRQQLLFAVMLNQYKLAVLFNGFVLLLALACCMPRRGPVMLLANILLVSTVFGGFEFDKSSGAIVKL